MSAWSELHQSVWTHRKTLVMAHELDIEPDLVVAKMARLWHWAMDNTPDGDLTGIPETVIAAGANWQGNPSQFVAAALVAGYLEDAHGRLVIHDYEEYVGKLIERRERNAERMRSARAKHMRRTSDARAGATEQNSTEQGNGGGGSKTINHADATETTAACSALGVPVSDTGATELVGKTTSAYPDVPHGLETVKCREHYRRSWPSKSPEQRALTYSKWCEKIPVFRQQDAERFGPARASPNGRHPPQTPYTPADPDEEAWWKKYDEELKRKNRERQQGNAPDRP